MDNEHSGVSAETVGAITEAEHIAAAPPPAPEPPTSVNVGMPNPQRIRVVDATTGDTIERVVEADSVAGTVKRMAVENGNLVREGDAFKVIEEQHAIRIEWADA